ncbi:hypothetical protein COX97_02685 [Candidatus Pacearchaeota archaeon CG_4_10_14_0_2_um_filter_05_32_18]|nr:MAG: hypothetical protein AUJ62_00905 [Candidatus Pacearchaeota archaeon CG1_02_32_21]PIZ82837.1 MAG: hypothetical protein COX97_02685 [Candidatus Pacearchaeota archaeon CG_4_10_14_0_2_um_filter_05_32_18]
MSVLICGFDDSNHAGDGKGDIVAGVFSSYLEDSVVTRFKNRRDRELFRRWFSEHPQQKDYRFAALNDRELRKIQSNLPLVAPALISDYLLSGGVEFDIAKLYFDGRLEGWHKEFLRDTFSGRFRKITIGSFVKKKHVHECPTVIYIADILAHDIYTSTYREVINNEKRVAVDESRLLRIVNGGKYE